MEPGKVDLPVRRTGGVPFRFPTIAMPTGNRLPPDSWPSKASGSASRAYLFVIVNRVLLLSVGVNNHFRYENHRRETGALIRPRGRDELL